MASAKLLYLTVALSSVTAFKFPEECGINYIKPENVANDTTEHADTSVSELLPDGRNIPIPDDDFSAASLVESMTPIAQPHVENSTDQEELQMDSSDTESNPTRTMHAHMTRSNAPFRLRPHDPLL